MYKPTVIKPKNHDAWIASRNEGIGASEVGAILGLSHFDTPYSVWRRKMGIDGPQPETIPMLMGHLLEEVVARRFEMETDYYVIKSSAADIIYMDPDKPFMRVTPDRIVKVPVVVHPRKKALLECKTTSQKVDKNNIPYSWLCQVQYQMRVTGYDVCFLAWLINGRDFDYILIEYDKEFGTYVEERITEFWTVNVKGNVEPPPISVEDVMAKTPESDPNKSKEADQDALLDIQELVRLNKIKRKNDADIEEVKSRLQVFMEDSETIQSNGTVLVTWKSGKGRASFDSKALQKDNPELYAKYYKEGKSSRTFLLKVGEE